MTRCDRSILEFLRNEGNRELLSTPSVIAANIDYAQDTVRDRMKPLRELSLVEYADEDRGLYRIAERGRSYILGEMSEEEAAVLDDELSQFSG